MKQTKTNSCTRVNLSFSFKFSINSNDDTEYFHYQTSWVTNFTFTVCTMQQLSNFNI